MNVCLINMAHKEAEILPPPSVLVSTSPIRVRFPIKPVSDTLISRPSCLPRPLSFPLAVLFDLVKQLHPNCPALRPYIASALILIFTGDINAPLTRDDPRGPSR